MKIKSNIQDVVIGSRTLNEYKFQILNFMNMLYDNIHYSDGLKKGAKFSTGRCMKVDVVCSNLRIFIKDVETRQKTYYNTEHLYEYVSAIHINLKMLEVNDRHAEVVKKQCDEIWMELYESLKKAFSIECELIGKNSV